MARIILKGIRGCLKGEVFLFEGKGFCYIGRTHDCNIQITREQDIAISRQHCALLIDPPKIKIRDLFSTNGTFVNDERLIPKTLENSPDYDESHDKELHHGDKISIGGATLLVEIASEKEPEAGGTASFSSSVYTTKTTKTRLIPFERCPKTKNGSLIPKEKPPKPKTEKSEKEPSETQRLLSMPITEPMVREMFKGQIDQAKQSALNDNEPQAKTLTQQEQIEIDTITTQREVISVVDPELSTQPVRHIHDPATEAITNVIPRPGYKSAPQAAKPEPPIKPVRAPAPEPIPEVLPENEEEETVAQEPVPEEAEEAVAPLSEEQAPDSSTKNPMTSTNSFTGWKHVNLE